MKLDVHVYGRTIARLYRDRDEYVLSYLPGADPADFVSLTMPVREDPWRWPRDLHPFFRQNLPEGYLLSIIREEFGPLLDGTDLSLLAVVGGMGIGRVTVTPEGGALGGDIAPLQVEQLLKAENTTAHFTSLVRRYARASISGMVPKFIAPENSVDEQMVHAWNDGMASLRSPKSSVVFRRLDEAIAQAGFSEPERIDSGRPPSWKATADCHPGTANVRKWQ